MKAKIYQPSKSVTQSGKAKSSAWILEYSRSSKTSLDPVMKWTSSRDTQQQVKIKFKTKELAVAFAEKNSIDYLIREPKKQKIKPKSYSDNFSHDKKTPWTH